MDHFNWVFILSFSDVLLPEVPVTVDDHTLRLSQLEIPDQLYFESQSFHVCP